MTNHEFRQPDSQDLPHGVRVLKPSGKPFKSGQKVNTISGYCFLEIKGVMVPAYTFLEDDSHVERSRCHKAPEPLDPTPPGMVPLKDLAKLPTPRLLAYWRKRIYTGGPEKYYSTPEENAQWDAYRASIKTLLNSREHIERNKS